MTKPIRPKVKPLKPKPLKPKAKAKLYCAPPHLEALPYRRRCSVLRPVEPVKVEVVVTPSGIVLLPDERDAAGSIAAILARYGGKVRRVSLLPRAPQIPVGPWEYPETVS